MCERSDAGSCMLQDGFDSNGVASDSLRNLAEVTSGDLEDAAVLLCLSCTSHLVGVRNERGVTKFAVALPTRVLPEDALPAHPTRLSA